MSGFFRNIVGSADLNSFKGISDEEKGEHCARTEYDGFTLTGAVAPAYDLKVIPSEGYQFDEHKAETCPPVPVIVTALTRRKLYAVFIDLLDPLHDRFDVVLETSHNTRPKGHAHRRRDGIDKCVLKSILWDYQDLLLNDGCTGIAVVDCPDNNPDAAREVQFDEHKLCITYAATEKLLTPFEEILHSHSVPHRQHMRFITGAEHVHMSSDAFHERFLALCDDLRVDEEIGPHEQYSC